MIDEESILAIAPILNAVGVEILSPSDGFVRCPGVELHTNRNADSDCSAFSNDGIPRLHCFHQSCKSVVQAKNRELYAVWYRWNRHRGPAIKPAFDRTQWAEKQACRKKLEALEQQARKALPNILKEYAWPYAAIIADSPEAILPDVAEHNYLLNLFEEDDIVWIGRDIRDSGRTGHKWRFRTALEWMGCRTCPGSFICPNTFKPGVCSRSQANVLARKFLVVESDVLPKDQVGAVYRWLALVGNLHLRAVVDTAGKSLHGWFDYPPPDELDQLEIVLRGFDCDPAMLKPAQPCRLPGALRDGKRQKLIYLS